MDFISLETLCIVIFCGAFVKFATTFGILRMSMGLEGALFGLVFGILSCVFSLLVLQPVFDQHGGLDKLMKSQSFQTQESLGILFNDFFEANTLPLVQEKLEGFTESFQDEGRKEGGEKDLPEKSKTFSIFLAGFLLSELIRACELALILLIPFIVLDLIVVNVLALLGIQQIAASTVSFPFKLALLVGLGAWTKIFEKLLFAYTLPASLPPGAGL